MLVVDEVYTPDLEWICRDGITGRASFSVVRGSKEILEWFARGLWMWAQSTTLYVCRLFRAACVKRSREGSCMERPKLWLSPTRYGRPGVTER